MTTTTPIAGNYTDNAAVAQRLKDAAVDALYSFRPGTGPLTVAPLSDELEVTARFIQHTWGYSAQLWARDENARIHAAAEASVIDPTGGSTIRSRIKQFRTGQLLWTHIAAPVNQEPIINGPNAYIAAAGEYVYQLHQEYYGRYRPVWLLTTPGLDLLDEERRIAGIPSAVAYIARHIHSGTGRLAVARLGPVDPPPAGVDRAPFLLPEPRRAWRRGWPPGGGPNP